MKVCEGRISSKFGTRKDPITQKAGAFHGGVDIACPIGTPVYSPVVAIVMQVYTDTQFGGGKTIILRDVENNDRYGFCHLSEQLVKAGMKIPKGFLFAKSGNTGLHSTGAHLHFSYATGGYWKEGIYYKFDRKDPTSKIEIR